LKFFKKAMGKGWKEAEEKLVKLPEDDPDIFALYEQVVYTGQIPLFDDEPERTFIDYTGESGSNRTTCTSLEKCQHEYEALAELYVLAEKLQDLKARNTTVEAIIREVIHEVATVAENPCLPSLAAITIMYSKTPRHCPGRQVLLDCFMFYPEDESCQKLVVERCRESSCTIWHATRCHTEQNRRNSCHMSEWIVIWRMRMKPSSGIRSRGGTSCGYPRKNSSTDLGHVG
jgi:hypothetical protein